MEEILSLVAREVKNIQQGEMLTAGMIISGGGGMLPGVVQLAEQMFNMPAQNPTLRGVDHIPDDLNDTRFATVLGLLTYGFANDPSTISKSSKVKGLFKRIENWISKQL